MNYELLVSEDRARAWIMSDGLAIAYVSVPILDDLRQQRIRAHESPRELWPASRVEVS